MSTDHLAEMAAEISRLRTKIVGLEAIVNDNEARVANTHGMAAEILRLRARDLAAFDEIRHLRARIAELEADTAITMGTLAQPTPDRPTKIEHNIPPSGPPHDER